MSWRGMLGQRDEVKHMSEEQEVLATMIGGKMRVQKVAPEDFHRQTPQVLKELEEQKTREALEFVQRKHKLIKRER